MCLQDPENPGTNPVMTLSFCCSARINVVPACFGDPRFYLCSDCGQFTEMMNVPIYEMISRGNYRKIKYTKDSVKRLMDFQPLSMTNFPPFGEKVFVAQIFTKPSDEKLDIRDLYTVGKLDRIDKNGFTFIEGDENVLNATLRKNKNWDPFVPTHFAKILIPNEQ